MFLNPLAMTQVISVEDEAATAQGRRSTIEKLHILDHIISVLS